MIARASDVDSTEGAILQKLVSAELIAIGQSGEPKLKRIGGGGEHASAGPTGDIG